MKISRFIFNAFGENTYVAYDPETLHAAIIDPGMVDADEERAISSFIERNGLTVTDMILTHVHIDHSFGVDFVKEHYHVPVAASMADQPLGLTRQEQAQMFHLRMTLGDVIVEKPLKEGDVIDLGPESKMTVIECPGHSPGGLALYSRANGVVFVGDSLFPGSIGRTDICGGDHAQLVDSIRRKLLTLPADTVVLPGHGDETTIAREKKFNPYLR